MLKISQQHLIGLLFSLTLTISTQAQNILFVGNSLTYANDLPKIVEQIGEFLNVDVNTTSLCYPNYAIEDHWIDGKIQKMMKNEIDFIVLQQGPSSQQDGRVMLIDYGSKIKKIADKQGIVCAYYMVWPSLNYYQSFDGVIANYTKAALVNQSLLIPAGKHWKAYRAQNPAIDLYSHDGFHPNRPGSFLAALTVFHTLIPEADLADISFEQCQEWIKDPKLFELMISLVIEE